jgi:uncharacterized membrane protein YeiB
MESSFFTISSVSILSIRFSWSGNILFAYGVCGSVCWFLRRLSPVRLVAAGACSLFIGSIISWNVLSSHNGFLVDLYRVVQECRHISEVNSPVQEMLIYRSSWFEQMTVRIPMCSTLTLWRFGC